MPTRDGYPEGVPCWVDLGTPDIEGAKTFYAGLFDWEYTEQETESTPYIIAHRRGLRAAGMGSLPDVEMPTVWTTYLAVDDIDITAERIQDADGTLLMDPLNVRGSGRMTMGADPTGAVFGVWEAGNHFGAAIVNEHGSLNWNELTTDHMDRALGFYESVFGFTRAMTETPSGRPYAMLKVDEREVAGAMPPHQPNIPNSWGIYFAVDDAHAASETAEAGGGEVTFGPVEAPEVGVFVGLSDPFGAHFTVIQLASPID